MAAKEEQIEVAFVGESDDLKLIAGDLDELDDSRIVEFELQRLKKELEKCQKQEFDFGRCEIEQCTKTITECKGAILVLSQELLYGKNDQISLYKIIFTLANLKKKERCGILVDMPRADLAVGLQNMRFVCLKKDEDQLIRQQKLASLERYLRESRDEIPKIGNIAQGQAFSNFFGFFNIVLPQLDVMWNDFEKKYMEDLKPPGVKCTIFRKMVEVMWPQGKNPDHLADELQGLGRIENIDKIISDKKLRKEVTESFTRVKSRCGAPERQYPAKLFRVYNQDKSKAFYFVGQIAPSGNVFHKVLESAEGDNSKKHRRWYAETSQKIADHRLNTDCNGKLFVLQVEDVNKADDQIFNALEKAESEKAESEKAESGGNTEPASPGGGDVEVKKCLIVNADYTHNESIDRIKKYLKKRGIDVAEIDFGQSELDGNIYKDVDLLLVFTAGVTNVQDFAAKCFAVGNKDSVLKLLVIKQSERSNNDECGSTLEMCPFTKEHQKIDDGLCINSVDLEKQLDDYLNKGQKHLLDRMLISDVYIGLAQAFLTNYLELQLDKLTTLAEKKKEEGVNAMLKLYELVPESGICSSERLKEIVTYEGDVKAVKGGRPYVTPMYSRTIKGTKVLFFMEYCTPIQVLHEMHESTFAPLLTDESTRREIRKFIFQLQLLINASEAIKDVVTVVPLGDDKNWEEEVTRVVEADWQQSQRSQH